MKTVKDISEITGVSRCLNSIMREIFYSILQKSICRVKNWLKRQMVRMGRAARNISRMPLISIMAYKR